MFPGQSGSRQPKQVFPHSQVTLKAGLQNSNLGGSIPGVIPCANGRQRFILNIRYLCHSLLNKTMTVHSDPNVSLQHQQTEVINVT